MDGPGVSFSRHGPGSLRLRDSARLPCVHFARTRRERIRSATNRSKPGRFLSVRAAHALCRGSPQYLYVAVHVVPCDWHPCEWLHLALFLGNGELLIATCDDTMHADFLATLLEAFTICPEAGIAACDVSLINRDGKQLTREDMASYLPAESVDDMLALDVVRSYPITHNPNYRPPPHDCLLHFSAKSVYFSLTQLLIRTSLAQSAEPFDTTVGSVADLGWLIRLTNLAGTVHVPRKLTMWRFHGNQLSVRQDSSSLVCLKAMFGRALPEIYQRHHSLLSRNDCATLMLPIKCYLANTAQKRVFWWLDATFRTFLMLIQRPVATLRAIRASRFLPHNVKRSLLPMFLQRMEMFPKALDSLEVRSMLREISSGPEVA